MLILKAPSAYFVKSMKYLTLFKILIDKLNGSITQLTFNKVWTDNGPWTNK